MSDTVNDEKDTGGVTAGPHFPADRYGVVLSEQEEPGAAEDALSALKAALAQKSCFVPGPGLRVFPHPEFLQAFLPCAKNTFVHSPASTVLRMRPRYLSCLCLSWTYLKISCR